MMIRIEDYGVLALDQREAGEVRGGDMGVIELGVVIAAAAGAGFIWGYNNLGPVLNRYF